jgi:hypothetical protein
MNLTPVIALCLLTALHTTASAQQSRPSGPPPPPPTLTDVQRLVQMIRANNATLQIYRQLGQLDDQMTAADEKRDTATADALSKHACDLAQIWGHIT